MTPTPTVTPDDDVLTERERKIFERLLGPDAPADGPPPPKPTEPEQTWAQLRARRTANWIPRAAWRGR